MQIIEYRDGVLRDETGGLFGRWAAQTVLDGMSVTDESPRVLVRSGAPSSGLIWSVSAWASFEEALGRVRALAERAGVRACVCPASGQTVSDVPSCLRMLESHVARAGPGIGLVLDPAGCVPPGSAMVAEEFVDRASDLVGLGGVDAVVIRNVGAAEPEGAAGAAGAAGPADSGAEGGTAGGPAVAGCVGWSSASWRGFDDGMIDGAALGRLGRAATAAGVPVVLGPADAGRGGGLLAAGAERGYSSRSPGTLGVYEIGRAPCRSRCRSGCGV